MRSFVVCALCVLIAVGWGEAHAQIYECNGKWTNLPCEGTQGRVLKESHRPGANEMSNSQPVSSATGPTSQGVLEPLAPRTDLVRKLRKQNDEYKRKGGVTLSAAEIEGFKRSCEDRTIPFADCQAAYSEQLKKLSGSNQKKDELPVNPQQLEGGSERKQTH